MTSQPQRQSLVKDIIKASNDGARLKAACDIVGISLRTLQRWQNNPSEDRRPLATKNHPNALSSNERRKILDVCNSEEYRHLTPNQIVPLLAQKGQYLASEATFYKILKEEKLLKHRFQSKPPRVIKRPKHIIANGPDQLWSWDITYLKTDIKGLFFYLYMFMDVWSRKIVGWTVEEVESGEIASKIIEQLCTTHDIESIYLHSDNGSPMTCGTMKAKMDKLGITLSYSRPSVSNDNPFSEALFKTVKYCPSYPPFFFSLNEAQAWVKKFVEWYNKDHLHSGIKFVTPEDRHTRRDREILIRRHQTYVEAKKRNPTRWAGSTRDWSYQETVELNKAPDKYERKKIA